MYTYIMTMTRTQIYFDQDLFSRLKTCAKLNKTTVSGYIRQLLNEKTNPNLAVKKKSLLDLAKSAKKLGKSNMAKDFDKYLPPELR